MGEVLFWGLPALQFIPWRAYAWQQQLSGLFPLWNPFNGMGAPLLANYQLAWFYPPSWVSFPFQAVGGVPGLAWALTLLIPIHLAWAGWGMVRLVRALGFGDLAQLVSGLAFGLSGYLVARSGFFTMIWAGAWLPWILLGVVSLRASEPGGRESAPWLRPGLTLAVAFQLLAGHAQLTWYSLLLAGVWVLADGISSGSWQSTWKGVAKLAVNILAGACIAAIQFLPTAEFLIQSQRSASVDFELGLTYSFWPWRLLTLLSPNFFGNPGNGNYFGYASYWEDAAYIGFLPLMLALSTIPRIFSRVQEVHCPAVKHHLRFAWGIVLIGLLFALGKNTPVFPFLYEHIPTFSQFNGPSRWMIWVVFGLSLLAGIGAERWSRPVGKQLRWFKRLTAAAMALALGAGIAWIVFRDIQITFIESTALMSIWAVASCVLTLMIPLQQGGPLYFRWKSGVVIILLMDMTIANWGLVPAVAASFYSDSRSKPLLQPGNARTYLNGKDEYALKFRRFFRFSDYRPIEDWNELFKAALPNLNLLPGSQFHSSNNFDPLLPGRYSKWMNWVDGLNEIEQDHALALMNVGLKVERDVASPDGIQTKTILPMERVRWAACVTPVAGEPAAWDAVTKRIIQNNISSVVLEGASGSPAADCDEHAKGIAKILTETSQAMTIQTEADESGVLVVADTWYPGWQARLDGESVPLLKANYLFMGIPLGPGVHQVEIRYVPISFTLGAGFSLFGILLIFLLSMLRRHRVK